MARMRFMYDNLIDSATVTANSEATGFPVTNLQHEWFKKEWRSIDVAAARWAKFDLGSAQDVTALIIHYHNFRTAGGTCKIQANATDAWGAPSIDLTLTVTSNLIVYFWGAVQSYRWWQIYIDDVANPDGYVRIGRPFLGTYYTPTWNYIRGYSIQKTDPSVLMESTGGQVSVDSRVHYRQWIFDFNGITGTDKTSLDAIFDMVGRAKPYFISQNPDNGSTALYYVRNITDWKLDHIISSNFVFQLNIQEER